MKQRTIAIEITAKSVASGMGATDCLCILKPASENQGIVFRRSNVDGDSEFCLTLDNLKTLLPGLETEYFNLISFLPLLAVVRALGIDNIIVETNCREFPDMGNTASTLLFLVQSAGTREQNAIRKRLDLKAPVRVRTNAGGWIRLLPSDSSRMAVLTSASQEKNKKHLGLHNVMTDFTAALFKSTLCHARSDKQLDQVVAAKPDLSKQELTRLSTEKSYRFLFDTYSVMSLVPASIQADYIAFNATLQDNINCLSSLLHSEAYVIDADLDTLNDVQVGNQKSNVAV